MDNVHIKYLEHFVDLPGAMAVDMGCRDGSLVRLLAEHKAKVIGIPTGDQTPGPDGENISFLPGSSGTLSLENSSIDLVVYIFSFHHIPAESQKDALVEAHRVLRPGGRLHIVEPFSEGSYFELLKLIDDQTQARAKAMEAISSAWTLGLKPIIAGSYLHVERFDTFDDFRRRIITVSPARAKAFQINERAVREAFAHHGIVEDDGRILFRQPCRMYHFARVQTAEQAA
ncbi:hypothetical protein A6A04_16445 [Paramagnetospirillum marisnigri]|uniref:Methyltransferase type 11 domain-containing protein n=1 Tax=Paramagnetospirillum marisnigri TaxID=1285242 RepID=A0A178MQV0_9PROT|nr:class I SAM-dependent methyltransferase [Paramagnetospirillum marisnigri]OAN51246.1 hypothetical protein A6A04_16445 [Paramagnetospirillum marisnigri]